MLFRQIYDDRLAQAAYLIGCQRTGEAIIIDPQRDVDRYMSEAKKHGLRLIACAETHIHADFLAGSRQLAEMMGARVYVSDCGDADWKYGWLESRRDSGKYDAVRLKDGDTFRIGGIEFRTVHTPGHTPEHICFLVTDRGGGAGEPMGMLSGDFVFVGDTGRPDLLESAVGVVGAQEASAKQLLISARQFTTLPEYLQVWPAHGAGSACGKALGAVPQTTVGYEKRFNPAIRLAGDDAAFLDYVLSGQPEPPMYFARMKALNRDGAPVLEALPRPQVLTPRDIPDWLPDAVVLDTRPWQAFRQAHAPGALFTPFDSSFPTIPGCYVEPGQRIVLLIDERHLEEAVRLLVRIGLEDIVGFISTEVFEEYHRTAGCVESINEVEVADAAASVNAGRATVLDVRRLVEHEQGHIAGSHNIAHTRLMARLRELEAGGELLVHCRSGVRSSYACAYLKRQGFKPTNVAGGFLAWEKAGQPVETTSAKAAV
ncbi:MAG: MBL fold metallo-hydrolase [Phycisphaerales bacterium]|nr:MBL fold metallo-hydrolase [Phycisphaerales bacterium]